MRCPRGIVLHALWTPSLQPNVGLVEEDAAHAAPVLAACCLLRIAEAVALEPQRFDATKLMPKRLVCNMARGNIHQAHRISITCAQVRWRPRLCDQALATHTAGTCALISESACGSLSSIRAPFEMHLSPLSLQSIFHV